MGLKPAWRVEVDGRDISDRLATRLISISVTDAKGARSDRCEIAMHDDPPVDWPGTGRKIKVSLGWDGEVSEMGTYHFTRPESSGPPAVLRITAHSLSQGGGGGGVDAALAVLAADRQWSGNLGEMTRAVAGELGLRPVISSAVAARAVNTVQDGETYVSALSRTARDLGADMRIVGGRLIISQTGASRSAGTGRPMTAIRIDRRDVVQWSGGIAQANDISRVRARYQAPSGGAGEVDDGDDGDTVTLPETYPSEDEARAAAEGSRRRRRGRSRTLNLTLRGDPRISYGTPLDMAAALRPGLDGRWRVVEVTHSTDGSSSYMTRLKAEAVV